MHFEPKLSTLVACKCLPIYHFDLPKHSWRRYVWLWIEKVDGLNETWDFGGSFAFFFLHAFDKKGYNMLVFMLNLKFKSIWLVIKYLGHENVVVVVVKNDEKLLLPLLMETNKLLKPNRVG